MPRCPLGAGLEPAVLLFLDINSTIVLAFGHRASFELENMIAFLEHHDPMERCVVVVLCTRHVFGSLRAGHQ